MSSSNDYHSFLEAFACTHVSDGFMEDNGDRMLGHFMKMQGSSLSALSEVKELKDKGNGLYRQNYFDRAAACYDEACKLLSLSLGTMGSNDIQSLCDLAVSLNSNLAACALKLEEYRAASDLCSMILDIFPRNVKARFRRAVAYMKLKRFSDAELDLVEALVVEPSNKDVLRELDVVRGHLLLKENGKRMLEVTAVIGNGNNKKTVNVVSEADVNLKDNESVITEVMSDQSDMSIKDNESVVLEVADVQGNGSTDLKTSLKENEPTSNTPVLEFSKKGGGNSRLRIPSQSYHKLLKGRKLSFYHKKDLSTLTIRILNIEAPMERGITRECCKKEKKKRRRRRRSPKKRNSERMAVMKDNMTPLDIINVKTPITSVNLSASVTSDESSCASSICDNFSSHGNQLLQGNSRSIAHDSSLSNSLVNEYATLVCAQDPNDHQPFLFSACRKICKISSHHNLSRAPTTAMRCRYPFYHPMKEKRRINMFKKKKKKKKNHRQEDELPRHNLSTFSTSRYFSHKFLRPRGISVSCCRYSSEAQFMKKRKENSAHLASSDRPFKKPSLSITPILSLFSYSNNVIIKSDSESRVCSV